MARILLVDDDLGIRVSTGRILEENGYEVSVATNSAQCLEKIKTKKPDLVLLDIMMPDEDGWEACRKIKADERTKDIPVVMFTVQTSDDSVEKSLKYAHADAHIGKPFYRKKLLDTIERLLTQAGKTKL
ncbi:MAG: response regulator [Candidatus Hydrothermarchaeaceae archaeon]